MSWEKSRRRGLEPAPRINDDNEDGDVHSLSIFRACFCPKGFTTTLETFGQCVHCARNFLGAGG